MLTVRHLERQWNAKHYVRLQSELTEARPEARFEFDPGASLTARTASWMLIRLEELDQAHVPLAASLRRTLVAVQDKDGGWGDPAVTALVLRALLLGNGDGPVVDRGIEFLANLQQDDGAWPAGPIRRMSADPATSLFVLSQLADSVKFRKAVRFQDALDWLDRHRAQLDARTAQLCERVKSRYAVNRTAQVPSLWS